MDTVIVKKRHRSHSLLPWVGQTISISCGKEGSVSFPVRVRKCKYCEACIRETPGNMTSFDDRLFSKCPNAPRRLTKWDYWFNALKTGDKVIAIQPWSDREYVTTIGRQVPNEKMKTINLRRSNGTRYQQSISRWYGDCYLKIIPVGYELNYSGKAGYSIRKKKPTHRFYHPKEGKTLTIRFLPDFGETA